PLGGYVKMLGQEDFDDKAEELKFKDDPSSFVNKPVSHRMAIVSAGVVMNILFSFLLFMFVYMIGKEDPAPRIAVIEPDSPAETAGIMPGDIVTAMNGRDVLTFKDIMMNVMLAPPHEPIRFEIERNGEAIPPIDVLPEKRRPEGSFGGSRLMVGIGPGTTSTVVWLPPFIDQEVDTNPRIGDKIVEVDGIKVTEGNVNQLMPLLGRSKGNIVVERPDPEQPEAPAARVNVNLPPLLALYPSDPADKSTANLLGFRPLMRVAALQRNGRGDISGLKEGDTIISWDDQSYPDLAFINAAIRDQPEHDIAFTVQRPDGSIQTGFVRPKVQKKGRGTIAAGVKPLHQDVITDDGPQAIFVDVRPKGPASNAGLKDGDRILEMNGITNPTSANVNRTVRSLDKKPIEFTVRGADTTVRSVVVQPSPPGVIGANYALIAEDLLIVGEPLLEIDGKPTPAAVTMIPSGSKIVRVAGKSVDTWTQLINVFQEYAGQTIGITFVNNLGVDQEAMIPIPHSLRTKLGLGPAARIVSIDGQKTVEVETKRGTSTVAAYYHLGTKALLKERVGQKDVPVTFRANPLATPETKYITITEDMVDPWLARVSFNPNVALKEETTIVKGANALDAVRIGINQTTYVILQVYQTIKRMVYSRSVGVENISGPLGIVSIGGQIARLGLVDTLFFMALISANLAVINFLPLPIVDGGLMVFLIIEKIKGSPVSLRVQVATQMIGLALIISCFLFVTYNDALRLWGS
ncbi:MAG: site-2 protease family protein, partial [Phycisphaerae bacterium]